MTSFTLALVLATGLNCSDLVADIKAFEVELTSLLSSVESCDGSLACAPPLLVERDAALLEAEVLQDAVDTLGCGSLTQVDDLLEDIVQRTLTWEETRGTDDPGVTG